MTTTSDTIETALAGLRERGIRPGRVCQRLGVTRDRLALYVMGKRTPAPWIARELDRMLSDNPGGGSWSMAADSHASTVENSSPRCV